MFLFPLAKSALLHTLFVHFSPLLYSPIYVKWIIYGDLTITENSSSFASSSSSSYKQTLVYSFQSIEVWDTLSFIRESGCILNST